MDFSEAIPFLEEQHNAIVTSIGPKGAAQATIVRAGPYQGKMAFVVRGRTVKLKNLTRDPHCTVLTVKPDWSRYASVEGHAEIHSPANSDPEELRLLLRAAFASAGGAHDNWDEYDRVMREEQRSVVLVTPERVYGRVS